MLSYTYFSNDVPREVKLVKKNSIREELNDLKEFRQEIPKKADH